MVYYFFDFDDSEKQTATNFIQSCLSQLCHLCPATSIPPGIISYIEKYNRNRCTPIRSQLLSYMKELMELFPSVVIVIDAIDECRDVNDTNPILAIIRQMLRWNNMKQHIVIASRRQSLVHDSLAWRCTSVIAIEGDEHKADIDSYIDDRLKIGRLKTISDELHISKRLKNSAGNM